MKTQHLLLLLFTAFCLSISCEDVIEVEVPTSEPRLVIEANVLYPQVEFDRSVDAFVKLTLTAPFFDEEVPRVTGAEVSVIEQQSGSVFDFIEISSGLYRAEIDIAEEGIYTLNVVYEDQMYTATEQLVLTVPIDNLEQGDGTLLEGDETEVIITFTDDGSRDDFYFFDLDFENYVVSEDRFYQGSTFSFSYFYDDVNPGTEIRVQIQGITKQYHDYSDLILEQTDPDGPFATPATSVRGNIVNTTNPDNYPFGYFRISQVFEQTIVIE